MTKYVYSGREFYLNSTDGGQSWNQFGHSFAELGNYVFRMEDDCEIQESVEENQLWLELPNGKRLLSDLEGESWQVVEG